jgi:ceramide glucosyltransferase
MANHLADDYRMGELVRALGLRVVLSHYLPRACHEEPSYDSLHRHELRWMRTIHVLQPLGFKLLCLSFSLPLAALGLTLSLTDPSLARLAWQLFAGTLLARLVLHLRGRRRGERPVFADLWLLPWRDLLILWAWSRSFLSSRISWRGNEFEVGADGVMRRPP